jgi:hypothetical protein
MPPQLTTIDGILEIPPSAPPELNVQPVHGVCIPVAEDAVTSAFVVAPVIGEHVPDVVIVPLGQVTEVTVPGLVPPFDGGVNCAAHDRAASAKTVTSFMVPLILDDSHGNV